MPVTQASTSPWIRYPRRQSARSGVGWTVIVIWASIATLYLISNLMLTSFGLSYETSGGAQWEKIAPATYFAFAALIVLFAERGNPWALLDDIVRRHKGVLVFLTTWAMLFAYIVVFQGSPLTATFDSFLLPLVLTVLIGVAPESARGKIALFLHVFMAVNALLGLAEFATGWRLTPLVAQGMVLNSDYRSSAFLGHPLNNAIMVGSYAVMLMLGGADDLKPRWRAIALLLQVASMAVFGGRFATLLFVAFAGVIAGRHALALLQGRRFSLTAAAAASFLVPAIVIGIVLLVADGFLDKFIMRFVSDEGSAESRVKMFELIGRIPFTDLLIGADPEVVATLQRTEGIAFGIESFWVAFIAYYGILVSVPFFLGLIAYCGELWRTSRASSFWPILFFMMVCSTSASLSGKSTTLAQFVVLLLILMRRRPKQGRA